MKSILSKKVMAGAMAAALATVSGCEVVKNVAGQEEEKEETKSAETLKQEENAKKLSASTMDDLDLSSVLSLQLPDSVKGAGEAAALRLNGGKKSFETCRLRMEMKEGLGNISQAATTFCHLEKAKMGFGKKYSVKFKMPSGGNLKLQDMGDMGPGDAPTEGDPMTGSVPAPGDTSVPTAGSGGPSGPGEMEMEMPSIQVWVDDSKKLTDGKIRLYMCQDEKLQQFVEIEGAGTGTSKGSILMKGEMDMGDMSMAFHRAALFDNGFTTEGTTAITVKERVTVKSTQFGDQDQRRMLSLVLPKDGISRVASSFAGKRDGQEDAFSSIGFFDDKFGAAIARGKISAQMGGQVGGDFSNSSFFDGKGYIVDPDSHPEQYGAGKPLFIDPAKVPGFLPADFKPEDLPADAWDCKGADEELEIDPTDSSHAACEEDWNQLSQESCFDAAFAQGEAVELPAETADPEKFEGFEGHEGMSTDEGAFDGETEVETEIVE
jgi:hypothetical protein